MDLVNLSVLELKNLCKENGLSGYSKMKKSELINLLSNSDSPEPKTKKAKTTRTKASAGENERKDIEFIIAAIHARNKTGSKFIDSFYEKFGIEMIDAKERSGTNRGTHYDFDIHIRYNDGKTEWKQVEHKGSQHFRSIKDDESPWAAGVQFHNGGCAKYSCAQIYAKKWYDTHIGSGTLKVFWKLKAQIPTFTDWWDDCCIQGDPKTAFGIELKEKVRASCGPKASLLKERAPVISAIDFTEVIKKQLISEVLPIANSVLEQKDYWLTVCGNLESGKFNIAWSPNFTISAVEEVVVTKKKDIHFEFRCVNNFKFNGILRWGKGAGFSCLRIDLK